MKKLSKLLALAAGLATIVFASCSDLDASGTAAANVNDKTANVRDYSVSFVSANGERLNLSSLGLVSDDVGRTIYDKTSATDKSLDNFKFYLWGTNEVTNATITPSEVTFTLAAGDTSKSTGSVALDLGAAKYKLVLAAVKGGTTETTADGIKGKATYVGYANVDTRTTSAIKFVISSDGLTGESTVSLTVKYDGLDSADGSWAQDDVNAVKNGTYGTYTITAGIYNRATNAVVGAEAPIEASDFFGSGAAYSATVQAGTYNFVVKFANEGTSKTYEYSDTIIVLANNDFSDTVEVPDVIEKAPEAPASFKVGYIAPASVNDGEYNAVLTWEDTPKNEKYYLIDVWDIPTTESNKATAVPSAAITNKTAWAAAINGLANTNQTKYSNEFYGKVDQGWVSGSLLKNNTSVVLKLSLGHRYIMRIAGINDAVTDLTANYAYATYDLDEVYTSADAAYDTGTSYAPAPFYLADQDLTDTSKTGYKKNTTVSNCANLYRLTYHLYGGTLALDSTITGLKADVVAYLTQDAATGVVIHSPYKNYAATTATYPSLIKNGNRWTSWTIGQVDGTKYPYDDTDGNPLTYTEDGTKYYEPNKYKGCENLDLFASYAVAAADVERFDDSKYVFVDGEVFFTEVTNKVTKTTPHAYIMSADAGSVTLNYFYDKATANKKAANVAYTSLKVIITRSGTTDVVQTGDFAASATTRSVAFNITPLSEGKYNVMVVGTFNGHTYTYPIVMTVES